MIKPLTAGEILALSLAIPAKVKLTRAAVVEPQQAFKSLPGHVRVALEKTPSTLCNDFFFIHDGADEYLVGTDVAGFLLIKRWKWGAEVTDDVPLFSEEMLGRAEAKANVKWSLEMFLRTSASALLLALACALAGGLLLFFSLVVWLGVSLICVGTVIVVVSALLHWYTVRFVLRTSMAAIAEVKSAM